MVQLHRESSAERQQRFDDEPRKVYVGRVECLLACCHLLLGIALLMRVAEQIIHGSVCLSRP
jgi:hypothetical protein